MYTCICIMYHVNMFFTATKFVLGQYIIQVGTLHDFDTSTRMYTGSVMIIQIIFYFIIALYFNANVPLKNIRFWKVTSQFFAIVLYLILMHAKFEIILLKIFQT